MKAIWKFAVLSTGPCEINVPSPGIIRHVGRDPLTGLIAFWAEVDTERAKLARRFEIVATGQTIPERAKHVGTVIIDEIVFHLFELPSAHARGCTS